MTTDDNVISIASRLTGTEHPPVETSKRVFDECRHDHIWVDDRLRKASCRDCGVEPLDPMECLIALSRDWERWQREYKALMDLRAKHESDERGKWERARDRHLNANPTHRVEPFRNLWMRGDFCRICQNLSLGCPPSVKAVLRADEVFDRRKLDPA